MASVAAIRDHYDSLALVYQTFWGDHLHHGLFVEPTEEPQEAQVRMLDHCIRLLVLDGDEEVLDLGCGLQHPWSARGAEVQRFHTSIDLHQAAVRRLR